MKGGAWQNNERCIPLLPGANAKLGHIYAKTLSNLGPPSDQSGLQPRRIRHDGRLSTGCRNMVKDCVLGTGLLVGYVASSRLLDKNISVIPKSNVLINSTVIISSPRQSSGNPISRLTIR